MTKLSELKGLHITETEYGFISSPGHCEFCGQKIQWYRYKGWIGEKELVEAYNFPFEENKIDKIENMHLCKKRPTRWAKQDKIPEGWEYKDSDNDDDTACFITKKYTKFE